MSSDNYVDHSLIDDRHDEVVQSLQYNIDMNSLRCGTIGGSNSTTFSVTFTDIGNHDEVLLSCGLILFDIATDNVQYSMPVSVGVLRPCKLQCHYFKRLHIMLLMIVLCILYYHRHTRNLQQAD